VEVEEEEEDHDDDHDHDDDRRQCCFCLSHAVGSEDLTLMTRPWLSLVQVFGDMDRNYDQLLSIQELVDGISGEVSDMTRVSCNEEGIRDGRRARSRIG
jgi:hypothetical protein